jgi:predicted MFS family arabinose efflux permease
VLGALHLWQLYTVAGLYGFLKMANWAGVPTIVPALVDEDDLNTANAMESVSFGLADVAGPAVAGVLIAAIGAAAVLGVDAASYVVFIGFLLGLRIPSIAAEEPASNASDGGPAARGLRLGPALRFVRRSPPVMATTLMFMGFNVGEGMMLVLIPVYARQQLGGGARTFGILLSAFALAALVGSGVVGSLNWRAPLVRSIAATQAIAGSCYLALLASPRLPLAIGTLVLAGVFTSPMTIWAQTIRMRLIPPEMRGRVFGMLRTLMQSTPPLGAALGGVLLARGDLRATVVLVAGLMAIPGLVGLIAPGLSKADAVTPRGQPERTGPRSP